MAEKRILESRHWIQPYITMSKKDFYIFRQPSTKKYRKAYMRLKRLQDKEIDKRWNWYHHYFKRLFMYKGARVIMWLAKKMGM